MRLRICVLALAASLASAHAMAQSPPVIKLATAPLVSPAQAWLAYGGASARTTGIAAWSDYTPEIKALGRSLGAGRLSADAYAQNVDDYILNNIAVEYRFGLGKGGRGALIDQSGTPFDQAELMVKLLRFGGLSASYQLGTIKLTPQQFGLWTGLVKGLAPAAQSFTVDAKAACQFLADGAIPAIVNDQSDCASVSGDLTTVTLAHIWVSANAKLYDPSFKFHALVKGVDLPAAMSCGTASASTCGSQLTTAMMVGATTGTQGGAPTLQNVNQTGLSNVLLSQAVGLQASLEASGRFARAIDVVGGKSILPATAAPASVLSHVSSVQATWTGEVPDQYRTTLSVTAPGCAMSLFFADEIAGRRISYSGLGAAAGLVTWGLYLDGATVPLSCSTTAVAGQFVLDVAHPYGGTYGDDHAVFDIVEPAFMRTGIWDAPEGPPTTILKSQYLEASTVGSYPVTIVHAFGDASTSAQQFMSELQTASPVMTKQSCRATSSTAIGSRTCENDRQPVAAESVSAMRTLSSRLVAGVTGTATTRHHDIGVIFSSRNPGLSYISLQELESINSKTSDSAARSRAFEIEAATLSVVEGAAAADDPTLQVDAARLFLSRGGLDWSDGGGSRFYMGRIAAPKFIDVSAANMASVLASLPDTEAAGGYLPWRKARLQAAANAGYAAILNAGSDGEIFIGPNARGYTVWESLKGAAGSSDPVASAMRTTELADAAARRRKVLSASLADGRLQMEAEPDIVTGAGDFPFSLPFSRTFVGSGRDVERISTSSYYGDSTAGQTTSTTYMTVRAGADSDNYARLGGGWVHNYSVTASVTGNPAKALGEDYALEGAAAIARIVALNDLFGDPTFQNRITGAYVTDDLGASLYTNSIVVKKGAASEVFSRLPSGAYVASGPSSAKVVQPTGIFFGPITYTGANGDVINFTSSFMKNLSVYSTETPVGNTANFKADSWVFPDGVSLAFTYEWKSITSASNGGVFCTFAGSCSNPKYISVGSVLKKVSNNLGRSLSFSLASVADSNNFITGYRITAVTDEVGRSASFPTTCATLTCDVFSAVSPGGETTRYEYVADANSPDPVLIERPNYRIRRWYTPGSGATPYRTVAYDDLMRISAITDPLNRQTRYFAGAIAGTEQWKRAETVSPRQDLAEVTTMIFDDKNNLLQTSDPLGRVTRQTYDSAGRLIRSDAPEGNAVEKVYDVRGNVTRSCTIPKQTDPALKGRSCDKTKGDIVTLASYEEGASVLVCQAPATCNKPSSETDARDGVTSYDWDNVTGLLVQVRGPVVDGSGARPQTDLSYDDYSGPNNGGVIKLLGRKTEWISSNRSVVTAYAYDTNNKLVLKSATIDPDGLALRTCFQFDPLGNLVGATDPRATACP